MPDPLHIRPAAWTVPSTRPAMANEVDRRPGLALTSRYLERDGVPWVPVSGEVHYSRVPRERWRERLLLARSGGVDVVATYVLWIHHEPVRGQVRFDGDLDVAAFVRTCAELGLSVVLRVGPWCHAEVRNGGLPDWVQDAPLAHRTDDPAYLDLVRGWFGRLGAQLAGLCGPDGPVLGIQLDNELYDQPGHLVTLKRLAREAGLHAPVWTATAWGGAQLPAGEVLPLYGGYGDGFWVDADEGWHPTFRAHYRVSHTWDDPGIGADVRGEQVRAVERDTAFPPATCELGGGMATTYHRRPVPSALDVAAVAHAKIASGSAWQGYYMYAGGTNPAPDLQESHATGYPNDLPTYDYDFHAPVGAAGLLAPSHAALRTQHAFLAAFGPALATMPATLPADLPSGPDDVATPRWSVRADGGAGFVFVVHHQPHVPLPTLPAFQVHVDLPDGPLVLPSRPVDVPAGTLARWPFGLDVPAPDGSVRLRWATASALTTLTDGTLVLLASAGVPVELGVDPQVRVTGGAEEVAPGVHALDERHGGLVLLHPADPAHPARRTRAAHATAGAAAYVDEVRGG
ncbi:beta-galactosidase, partial [Cellulomonas fimi]|uniref:beta-galactosidase n=1 Tax=Cellulomonas fimi TaxID=1708 RepID=UPI0028929C42